MHAERSILDFRGHNILERNSAGRFGGAAYFNLSNVTFYDSTCFVSNIVRWADGAIFSTDSMLTLIDNVTFDSNYGPLSSWRWD